MLTSGSVNSVKKMGATMGSDVFENIPDDPEVRRLFQELEHTVKVVNHDKISEITGDVSKEAFVNVAETVARLRARYLAKVLKFQTTSDITKEEVVLLKQARLMYEEAMEGFNALQHALGRGYFDLSR